MKPKEFSASPSLLALLAAMLLVSVPLSAQSVAYADKQLASCVAAAVERANVGSPEELISLTCNGLKIDSVAGIETLIGLESLSLFGNRLKQIDVRALVGLKALNVANNQLEQIELANNPALETLYLFGNALTSLNLQSNPALKKVKAENNEILNVVFPESTTLKKVYLFDNKMEDIQIDSLKVLRFLDVRSNPMPDEVYDYLDEFSGVKASHDGNTEEWR